VNFITVKPYLLQDDSVFASNSTNFNILDFWEDEIIRVNNTPLNIVYGGNSTLKYIDPYTDEDYDFTAQEIHFDSPNWVNATSSTLKLQGYILYPEIIKSNNSGCLCMHGLGGNANDSFELAYSYLKKGFIVLCYSHPGHGESEGAEPTSQNFFFEGLYNQTSHNYLTLCGAVQGLRLLENLSLVNNSQIMVTGSSYGALNTMWLSGICGERIAGALPYIAVGDHQKDLYSPSKLLFWVWGRSAKKMPDSFWENQNLRVDPIYYLKSSKMPPILWQIGTNDEFFDFRCINGTFEAVNHSLKFIQIYAGGHHMLYDWQNTTEFFIDYIVNNGASPPNITVDFADKTKNLAGDNLVFNVDIQTEINVESVQVVYKYLNILGATWVIKNLNPVDSNTWEGVIKPGIITSEVAYYFIINIEVDENIWFSSNMFEAGVLHSTFTILFYILITLAISIPIILIFYRRYSKDVKELKDRTKEKAKKVLLIEFISLGLVETIFFSSFLLPVALFGRSGVSWSTVFILNNLYTWTDIFGVIAPYIASIFIIIFIVVGYLSLMKPIIASVFKFAYFLYMILLYALVTGILKGSAALANFGAINFGIGLYLILVCSILLFIIGIWKRHYQTALGIRIPKEKLYNIDRWFRIKSS